MVFILSFEALLEREEFYGTEFGKAATLMTYRPRPHISRSRLDSYSNAVYIETNESVRRDYSRWHGERYVVAKELTFDLLLSLYEVNTARLAAFRYFGPRVGMREELERGIKAIASWKPNIEARLIGLQNNEDRGILRRVMEALSGSGVRLVEVDLFGESTRHVAIDTKLGASYDVLLEDRHYRAGELTNRLTIEDFERNLAAKQKKAV